jgi:hypothetical protein
MASVQNCSLLQKDSTDERNGLHARPARRRGKLGAAATGLLPDEAMRARMIRKGQRLWGLQPPTIGDRRAAARRGCRMAARRTRAAAMPVIGFLSHRIARQIRPVRGRVPLGTLVQNRTHPCRRSEVE